MTHLLSLEQRRERVAEKRELVIDWLLAHGYSCRDVLEGVMHLQRNATNKTIASLVRDQAARIFVHESFSGPIRLVVPTAHGAMTYGQHLVTSGGVRDVERAALGTVLHALFVQRAQLRLLRDGYATRMAPRALAIEVDRNRTAWLRQPDVLMFDASHRVCAIEAERIFKNPSRYRVIMADYLRMVKLKTVDRVVYVTADAALAQRLAKLFQSFDFVEVDKQRLRVEPHHRAAFTFLSLKD